MSIDRRTIGWVAGAVAAGTLLLTLDIMSDPEELSIPELMLDIIEMALMLTGAGGVVVLLRGMHAQHREKLDLIRELEIARSEGVGWRSRVQSHVAGIGAEIERQFQAWGLTEAESEVGLLLIKGLTHKDIAALRGTAEATVRQQARSVYQKSGLPGRTAFSAYFLEDLLPPDRLRRGSMAPATVGYDAESQPKAAAPAPQAASERA